MAKYELSLTVENANLEVTPEGPVTLSVLELVGPRGETGPQGPAGPTGPAGTTQLDGLTDVDTSNASTGNLLRADGDGTFSFVSVAGVSDDLDDVTSRGGTTTNDISVGALTATSLNTHTIPTGTGTLAKTSDIPTNNNQLTNGAGYVTEAEAQAAISVVDAGGDGSLAYSSGTITYTGPSAAEVRAHLSSGGDLSYNSTTGVISFTERTDSEVRQLLSVSGDLSYDNTTGVFSFTERTDSEVRGLVSATDAGGDGSFSYNNSTGIFTYTGPSAAEVRAHLSAGGDLSYNSTTGEISFTERTDAEVRQLFSVSGDLSYNNTTGVFSFTERTDAEVRGLFSVAGDLSYNSTTGEFSFTERTDAEVRGLLSASGDISYNSTTGVFSFTERTDAEVRGLLSASGDISYNSTTGEFSFTERTDAEVQALITGGTGVTVTSGVVAIGQAVNTNSDVTFKDVTVSGDLTVSGTTTTVNTETINLADNQITLNSNYSGNTPTENAGIEVNRGGGTEPNKTLVWDETADKWTVGSETFVAGTFEGDLTGAVTGNSDTASTLATARTISLGGDLSGSTSFDGSADVTITAAVADDSHNHIISNVDGLQTALDGKLASVDLNYTTAASTGVVTNDAGTNATIPAATTTTAGLLTSSDKTKLDGVEVGATADQTDAEIKTAYENNSDTNAFTDAEKTKLSGIETDATADQTGAEIKSLYEAQADTNAFTDNDHSKLDGIEALADVTDATNVAAAGAVMETDTSTVNMSFVVDEDDMTSNSATKVPTQQSVKAYVDANAGGAGDITSVVAGSGLTGGATTGDATLNVGAGNYITVAADTVTVDATDANTASKVVARDGSGNFSAGTITADLTGDVTGTVSSLANHDTDDLAEGTNLYYTAARFDTAFSGKDTDNLSEGSTNLYYTDTRANAAIDARVDEAFVNALNVEAASADTLTFTVKNSTGSTLEKGSVVYVSGLNGNTPEVSLARANSSSTMPAFGLVEADIANAADGVVTTFGSLTGLNVADFGETGITFSLGDTVYVSSSEAGKLTNVAPTGEANLIQNIGKIERASPTTNMTIKVGGAGRTNATPNLNDGKFFLGNASNQAVSADFTTSVRGEVSATDAGGDGSFSYDSGTGVFTYTGPSATEVRAHLSAGGDLSYDSATGVMSFTERTDAEVQALITGGTGVTVNNGVVAIGQAVGTGSNVTFNDVVVSNDLTVNGSTTTIDSTTVAVADSLFKLAKDNTADSLDAGWYGVYNDGTEKYAGIARDASDSGKFILYDGLQVEPTTTVNTAGTGFNKATLKADIEGDLTGDVTGSVTVGSGKTLDVSAGTLTLADDQISGDKINGGTIGSVAITSADINGGNIDGTVIGATTRAAVSGTTGNFNSTLDVTGDLTVDTDTLHVDATNNQVAIGNTSAIGSSKLSVYSDGAYNPAISVRNDGSASSWSRLDLVNDQVTGGNGILYYDQSANFVMRNDKAGAGVSIAVKDSGGTVNSNALKVTSDGNVGLGTALPTEKLEVDGSVAVSADSTETRYVKIGADRTGNGYSYLDLVGDAVNSFGLRIIRQNNGQNAASILRHAGTGPLRMKTEDSADIIFDTVDTERMRIDSSGNVGIGTNTPTGLLELSAGTGDGTLNLVTTANVPNAGNKIAFFGANRSNTDEEMAYIKPLLVSNSGGAGNVQTGDLTFGTSGSERMRVTSDGKVGIGTTSPASELDVDGTIQDAQGNVRALNRTVISSTPYSIPANSSGKFFSTTTGANTITIAAGNCEQGQIITIYNHLSTSVTFSWTNMTSGVFIAGDTTNLSSGGAGSVTIAGRGLVTIINDTAARLVLNGNVSS